MKINSISIRVGTGGECISMIVDGGAAIYIHGSYDEIREFAAAIKDKATADEAREWAAYKNTEAVSR